jgi:hypothetical protein
LLNDFVSVEKDHERLLIAFGAATNPFHAGIKFVGFECTPENSYSRDSLPLSVAEVFMGSPYAGGPALD